MMKKIKELIEKVVFDIEPKVRVRVISSSDSRELAKEKKKFPFKLDNDVIVTVFTNLRKFSFKIKRGYIWNGADIPRVLWKFIGASTDNAFLIASMIHDFMLDERVFIYKDVLKEAMKISEYRRLTSLVFREILKDHHTGTIKANVMAGAVDWFQKYIMRGNWRL